MIKHTPGPWIVVEDRYKSNNIRERAIRTADTKIQIAVTNEYVNEDEMNAKLISAAPELLLALQTIVFDWDGEAEDMYLAREAIRKATQ